MNRYILVALTALLLIGCTESKIIINNFADINDHKKFPSRQLSASNNPFIFYNSSTEKKPNNVTINGKDYDYEKYLEDNQTVAFLIIQNDTILYERYFRGYEEDDVVPSFSMAKSVTSILIGCAIEDGLIESEDDKIIKYLPQLEDNGFGNVTIKHILQMTSALDFNEGYKNPFGEAATFYYGRNLRKYIDKLELKGQPGQGFEYVSGNTQILGLLLDKVLGEQEQTVTEYLNEKIWKPIAAEYPASWSIDKKKDGLEKTFCCINATARDYAKIGRLYLNNGNWDGEQLISAEWVKKSTAIDTTNGSAWFYQYQWWLPNKEGDFMAKGILGQFIYVNPNNKVVIVRLGRKRGDAPWERLLEAIAKQY